jgi:hypothetical protein
MRSSPPHGAARHRCEPLRAPLEDGRLRLNFRRDAEALEQLEQIDADRRHEIAPPA